MFYMKVTVRQKYFLLPMIAQTEIYQSLTIIGGLSTRFLNKFFYYSCLHSSDFSHSVILVS